jgi:hypothetical protein
MGESASVDDRLYRSKCVPMWCGVRTSYGLLEQGGRLVSHIELLPTLSGTHCRHATR